MMRGMGDFINPGVIIFIGFSYIFLNAGLGAWLAEKKGYSSGAWFFICLLTGPVGLIALAGAPSQYIESSLNEIKRLVSKPSGEVSNIQPLPVNKISGPTWFCKKCQTENPLTADSCKGCGEYR